jgi:predicted component of type VI protein secretion system
MNTLADWLSASTACFALCGCSGFGVEAVQHRFPEQDTQTCDVALTAETNVGVATATPSTLKKE